MIGKPQWFTRRKYLGWGIQPKTWQGWVYLVGICVPVFLIQFIPQIDENMKNVFLMAWALVILVDIVDIMARMHTDEREKVHEAFAERNALWAILAVLVMGFAFQISSNIVKTGTPDFDPVILAAIVVGLAAKAATNIYLDRKD